MNRLEGLRKKCASNPKHPVRIDSDASAKSKSARIYPREIYSLSLPLYCKQRNEIQNLRSVWPEEKKEEEEGLKIKRGGKKKRREEVLEGIGAKEGEKKRCWKEKEEGGREKTASANVTGLHSDVGV